MKARTVAISGVAIALIAASIFAAWGIAASADESRTIPFWVFRSVEARADQNEGDACNFPLDGTGEAEFPETPSQIIVRDEHDTIVAVRTLDDGQYGGQSNGMRFCNVDTSVTVPDSAFYTVFFNDQRITTYSASDFPIDPTNRIVVSLSQD